MQTQPNDGDMNNGDIWLVYDGECPLCRTYCKYVRIRAAAGRLHLVDARQPGPLMDEITAAGLDIDQGMVVKLGGRLYYGPDAIHVLVLAADPAGVAAETAQIAGVSKVLTIANPANASQPRRVIPVSRTNIQRPIMRFHRHSIDLLERESDANREQRLAVSQEPLDHAVIMALAPADPVEVRIKSSERHQKDRGTQGIS